MSEKQTTSVPPVYEKPQVKVLGTVIDLTLGDTGVNGDGLLSGAKTKKS